MPGMVGTVSGTAVVNEMVMCVIAVRLRDRRIVFEARAHGPLRAGSATSYTLHDEAGAVVVRCTGIPELVWPDVGGWDTLTLVLPMSINDRTALGAG